MAVKTSRATSEETLRARLIALGVDPSAPDFRRELEAHTAAAQAAVPPPVDPMDEHMPGWFAPLSGRVHAYSRIALMVQVLLIQGGVGPLSMIALAVAEWYRVGQSVASFVTEWPVTVLLSGVLVFGYMYLALVKADLKGLLNKNEYEAFSIRRVWRSLRYTLGIGAGWTPRYVTELDIEFKRVSTLLVMYKFAIGMMTLAASVVAHITQNSVEGVWYQQIMAVFETGKLDVVMPVIEGVTLSLLLLFGIDWIIARAHRSYMLSDGGSANAADFLAQQRTAYAESRRRAGEQARLDFLRLQLRDAQVKAETLAALAELPPPVMVHTNGHSKPETVN